MLNSVKELAKQIVIGNRQAISKAITLVESSLAKDQRVSRQLLKLLNNNTNSIRLGFTGPPGSGKSTLLESFGLYLLNHELVSKLAVLAIDPSSSHSGGSILGDKTRMSKLTLHPQAYIRPSPARGSLGGITASTANAALICQAAGHDLICIESVGVGQSETAIAALSDVTVLVVAPGAGDDLQGIKKGVTECADIVVVNKCDLPEADLAVSFYRNALQLQDMNSGRSRRVLPISAKTGQGMSDLWSAIQECMTGKMDIDREQKIRLFKKQQLRLQVDALYFDFITQLTIG